MSKKSRFDDDLIPVERSKRVIVVEGRKRKKKRKKKGKRAGAELAAYIFGVFCILLVVTVAIGFSGYQSELSKVKTAVKNTVLTIRDIGHGTYEFSWDSMDLGDDVRVDYYQVEISSVPFRKEKIKYSKGISDTHFSLSLLELDLQEYVSSSIRITPVKTYTMGGEEKNLYKRAYFEGMFEIRDISFKEDLKKVSDPTTGEVEVTFDDKGGINCCMVYVTEPDGSKRLIDVADKEIDGKTYDKIKVLTFGGEEGLRMPDENTPCELYFVPGFRNDNVVFYGSSEKKMTVYLSDLKAGDFTLEAPSLEDGCICALQWEKRADAAYSVEMRECHDGIWDNWKIVKELRGEENNSYSSPKLVPGVEYSFRVIAEVNGEVFVSNERMIEAGTSIAVTPLYCTVWPVKTMDIYGSAAKEGVVGKAEFLKAYYVLGEENGMFRIRLNGNDCYMDSNYCMINLPEYLGDLCSYNITNSYNSIFTVHDYVIPELTGICIRGYENVCLYDGSFLVPLLYPTAKRLKTAVEYAEENYNAYRLKIYDAFRPHDASAQMFSTTSRILQNPLPGTGFDGNRDAGAEGEGSARSRTYIDLMIGSSSYSLNNFLAAGTSRHNIGVALDLTLENKDSREECNMQTAMHDLSHFSASNANKGQAVTLANIMLTAGFTGLSSEWWHFQDDVAKNNLTLPRIDKGVSGECWVYERDGGQRYRWADGNFATGFVIIDGTEYYFDEYGYIQN